jgi:uncharacterized protein YkwD
MRGARSVTPPDNCSAESLKPALRTADVDAMKMSPACRAFALACVACLGGALSACGGGGGEPAAEGTPVGSGAPAPSPGPSPTPSPPPAATDPAPLATCGLAGFQAQLLDRINTLRRTGADCGSAGSFGPASAVAWDTLLDQAATAHAQDMATANYFSHTSLDGRTLSQRIDAAGYAWRNIGENIAAGYGSVDAVMDGWTASPGHCANLMNPAFTEFAVACVRGAAGATYGTYWTMNLARPR